MFRTCMRCIRTMLSTVPAQHVRRALPVHYYHSPLKTNPWIWFVLSRPFCSVLTNGKPHPLRQFPGFVWPPAFVLILINVAHLQPAPCLVRKGRKKFPRVRVLSGPQASCTPSPDVPEGSTLPVCAQGSRNRRAGHEVTGASGRGTEWLVCSGRFHPKSEEEQRLARGN